MILWEAPDTPALRGEPSSGPTGIVKGGAHSPQAGLSPGFGQLLCPPPRSAPPPACRHPWSLRKACIKITIQPPQISPHVPAISCGLTPSQSGVWATSLQKTEEGAPGSAGQGVKKCARLCENVNQERFPQGPTTTSREKFTSHSLFPCVCGFPGGSPPPQPPGHTPECLTGRSREGPKCTCLTSIPEMLLVVHLRTAALGVECWYQVRVPVL